MGVTVGDCRVILFFPEKGGCWVECLFCCWVSCVVLGQVWVYLCGWGEGGGLWFLLFWVVFGLLVGLVSLCSLLFLCGFMIPVS